MTTYKGRPITPDLVVLQDHHWRLSQFRLNPIRYVIEHRCEEALIWNVVWMYEQRCSRRHESVGGPSKGCGEEIPRKILIVAKLLTMGDK